jgi:Rrf2 family iron-sulfur cluster assembly transcriptional regulator
LTIILGDDTRRESVRCASRGAVSTPKRPPKGKKNAVARKELAVKLSTKGRYAVMAMADLASREGMAGPVSLSEIAENQEISLSYLEQLFAKLRKGGLVVSVRGPGGGYCLSRPASELRVADIIVAVDEPISATRCKAGSPKGCTGTAARCLTHDLWEELGRQIHVFLSSVSLADVVEKRVLGSARLRNTSEARAAA